MRTIGMRTSVLGIGHRTRVPNQSPVELFQELAKCPFASPWRKLLSLAADCKLGVNAAARGRALTKG